MDKMQKTVKKIVSLEGVGVHSGAAVRVTFSPATPGTGIVFRRSDIPNMRTNKIAASWENVSDTSFSTTLQNIHNVSLSTVEHVMAALTFLGVDNVFVDVSGPEVPIMDGSAAPFVTAIRAVGLMPLSAPQKVLRILKEVTVKGTGDHFVKLTPSDKFELRVAIDVSDRASTIQKQSLTLTLDEKADELLASARTFGFYEDAEKLWSLGLAKGASLENTLVIKDNALMNEEGFRFEDELVRHKMLDAVGDLALAGYKIEGLYEAFNPGHGLNYQLLCALFSDPSQYHIVEEEDAPSFFRAHVSERLCALPSRF